MLGRLSLKTILIGGAVVAAAIPAALITILMVGSVRDSDIEEASARYELLAQTLAAEHDQILTSHRRAVQILTLDVEAQPSLSGPGRRAAPRSNRATYPAFEAIAVLDASGRSRRVGSSHRGRAASRRRGPTCPGENGFVISSGAASRPCRPMSSPARSGRAVAACRSPLRSRMDPAGSAAPSPPGSGSTLDPDGDRSDPLRQHGLRAADDGPGQDPHARESGVRRGADGLLQAVDLAVVAAKSSGRIARYRDCAVTSGWPDSPPCPRSAGRSG